MKKILAVILFLFCLSISSLHFALATDSPKPAIQPSANALEKAKLEAQAKAAEIDNLKIQIAVLKETNDLQREVDALKSQFDAHDKYVDRVINIAGISAALFGIVFAILGFLVRQDAKEAVKETVKIRDEAKELLESIKALHVEAKQKASDMADLLEKMKESGENPSAEIMNGFKQEFDKFSGEIATTLSKATAEKDKISTTLEKQLSAAKEAAQFLEKQAKLLPASHYFNLGYAAGEKGNYEEAILHYSKAIELNQDYVEAYNNRGTAKSYLGQKEEAIADYDKAIELKPDLAEAYNNRGNAKSHLGHYEEAIVDYDKAIQVKPGYASACNGKAEVLICLSSYSDAETTLAANAARFIKNKDKGGSLYLLRLALVAQGKDDSKVQTDYETLFKNNPDLNFKWWDCKPIEKKLTEIEKNKELPTERIEKMKAIHAEFKKLDK